MGFRSLAVLMVLLVASWAVVGAVGYEWGEEEEAGEEFGGRGERKGGLFMMERSKQVVKTEAGEMRVMQGSGWRGRRPSPLHIGFLSMEPNTLFLPQYLDACLVLFVRRGEAKVGWIYRDGLVERQLKIGDLYWIPAGSTFYIVNTGTGQRLHIICSIDTSESLGYGGIFQSFYIGGGSNPPSVLAGFDDHTLATAFNVTSDELSSIMKQGRGPIVYMTGDAAESASRLASLLQSKQGPTEDEEEGEEEELMASTEKKTSTWTWRKLFNSIIGKDDRGKKKRSPVVAPDSFNLYDRKPDFSNRYGWSVALDKHDYKPLKRCGVGVYLVNLTAGAMMAPHVNPTATEYGVVLSGVGRLQVVFPNGTCAMDAELREEDAFWVPRLFPFCQVASLSGPMEFFGFTTSARRNHPQFLVGASSVLRTMMGPEMAAAFGTSEERLRRVAEAQGESAILPPWTPRDGGGRKREGEKERDVIGKVRVLGVAA